MVLVGHSRHVARGLSRRERRVMLGVALGLVMLVAGVAVYLGVDGDSFSGSRDGCVNVVIPSTLGATTLHRCGTLARRWCESEATQTGALARLVLAQCAQAGLRQRRVR